MLRQTAARQASTKQMLTCGFAGTGPESDKCAPLIEAHKECLRAEGFEVCVLTQMPEAPIPLQPTHNQMGQDNTVPRRFGLSFLLMQVSVLGVLAYG